MPATLNESDTLSLLSEICVAGEDFHRRGWSLATSSNYSVVVRRDPLELLVTVSGKDKGRLTTDDFVRVGADGKPVDPKSPASSAETLLHTLLATELPDALPVGGSVLHTHSIYGTLLSDHFHSGAGRTGAGGVPIAGYEMLKAFAGVKTHKTRVVIPVFENTQDIAAMAAEIAPWLNQTAEDAESPGPHAFLIHNHGLYTWGSTVAAARRQIEALEFLFECEWRRLTAS